MKIETHTPRLRQIRKVAVELLLASHKVECPTCDQADHCKLEAIAHKLGVDKVRFKKLAEPHPIDNSSYAIVRDPEKCILCGQPIDFDAYGKINRRTDGLYRADKDLPRRKSQDNPAIIETYKKVLPEGPCAEKSHHLLHTKYAKRGNFR